VAQPHTFIGCCGWTEAQARYITTVPTIELQTPFYQPPALAAGPRRRPSPPALAVAKRWKTLTGPDFHFCIKAWQLITHTPTSPTYRRLKSPVSPKEHDLYGSFRPTEQVWMAWERTCEIANILDAQIIVFQCPKSFLPTRENTHNLSNFFRQVERDHRLLAWEPRGDDWHPELIHRLCSENHLIHCVDPFLADPTYGDTLYWWLHGRTGYRYHYTDEDPIELANKLAGKPHRTGAKYVIFNNMSSKQGALRFLQLQNIGHGSTHY